MLSRRGKKTMTSFLKKWRSLFVKTRAVYWASFFDTIRYNTFSCDIRYIAWTICLHILVKKIKNVQEQPWHTVTLVINRFRHMCGAFGWLACDKLIMSLVMDSDICLPTGCCNSLEHKLHSAVSYSFFLEYSQNLFVFC